MSLELDPKGFAELVELVNNEPTFKELIENHTVDLFNYLKFPTDKKDKDETEALVEEKSEKKISDADIAAACEKLRERYKKLRTNLSLEPWEVEEIFLNALTAQYDPHTTFFSKQSMEEFEITMRNSLCGIGAVLSMEFAWGVSDLFNACMAIPNLYGLWKLRGKINASF